ncbi:PH domain-containing protein [Caryophanon tenue]|uniref:YdbS-like PH domain-containing protein n=1 Tax=Caryophanon tenue TaxID=33978 RepID=A0A1C0YBG2_9BACL|nr:PH domain-containing protein [Caryophanon tenue]OCS84491.1 hypothetical protein A6M13_15045 [Caryophanon tenue]
MSNQKFRLHPVSALINFFKGLKEMLLPIVIIFFTSGGLVIDPTDPDFWPSLIPKLFLLVGLIIILYVGIVKWRTYVYWFEDEELRVEYGLFVKKKRYVPFERIQSLNYKEGVFHRLFKLVAVEVETAGGTSTGAEIALTAVTRAQADRIEGEMRAAKNRLKAQVVQEGEEPLEEEMEVEKVIHQMTTKDLLLLASTSGGVGVVLAGILAIFSQVSSYIPYEAIYDEVSTFVRVGTAFVISIVAFAFFLTWLISVLLTFINYYNFKVVEFENKIVITRGLLEKKRTTIPLSRVQGIRIVENPLRQPFGFATVLVECASGGGDEQGISSKINLFPLIKTAQIERKLAQILPQFTLDVPLTRSPKRAIPFFYRFDIMWIVPIIGALTYFFYPYGLLSLALIAIVMIIGRWQWKSSGYAIDEAQLVVQGRIISRSTFYLEKHRIQSMTASQSYFQKRRHLSSVLVTVMSGMSGTHVQAVHLEHGDADHLLAWFDREEPHDAIMDELSEQ